jgi:GAF domain-containing protein
VRARARGGGRSPGGHGDAGRRRLDPSPQVLLALRKYEQWKDFTAPARGIGLHALVVAKNEAICLTQEEVEQHPEWRAFADSAGKHPPLRGLLAVPIVGEDGLNYGLLQVSDKADGGDFDAEDERRLECLANAAAVGLDALRKVRALRLGEPAPTTPVAAADRFVVIERA